MSLNISFFQILIILLAHCTSNTLWNVASVIMWQYNTLKTEGSCLLRWYKIWCTKKGTQTSEWWIAMLNFSSRNLSIWNYYICKLVSLYNATGRNWSIIFDIGCVKMLVTWYRVCKKRTTFDFLLFTIMT